MLYSNRQALEKIVAQATRLGQSSLLKGPFALAIHWDPPNAPVFRGGDQLALDVGMRTARLFLGKGEPLAFDTLNTTLQGDPDISPQCRKELDRLWKKLDTALGRSNTIRVSVKGQKAPTQWELLRLFLFGDMDQVEPASRELVRTWLGKPTTAFLLQSQFQTALVTVCEAVIELKGICQRELLRAAG